MLGKLIKYEWKGTYRMGCLMLGAMAVVTFLGWLAFQAPVWRSLGDSSVTDYNGLLDVFSTFTLLFYSTMLVCVHFGTKIYLGIRFYRTMYTDEGYLTHTLPVTKNQILVSKIFISGIWTLIILISICLSMFLLGLSLAMSLVPDFTVPEILEGIGKVFQEMEYWFDFDVARLLVTSIFLSLIEPFLSVTILFGAISLGQLVSRGRLLMGILFYIIILVVEQLFVAFFRGFAVGISSYMNLSMDFGFVMNLLTAGILYAVTHYVISRKLNLI